MLSINLCSIPRSEPLLPSLFSQSSPLTAHSKCSPHQVYRYCDLKIMSLFASIDSHQLEHIQSNHTLPFSIISTTPRTFLTTSCPNSTTLIFEIVYYRYLSQTPFLDIPAVIYYHSSKAHRNAFQRHQYSSLHHVTLLTLRSLEFSSGLLYNYTLSLWWETFSSCFSEAVIAFLMNSCYNTFRSKFSLRTLVAVQP